MLLTLLPYVTAAVNLVLALAILLGLSERVRRVAVRVDRQEKALENETARFSAEIASCRSQMEQSQQLNAAAAIDKANSEAAAPLDTVVNMALRTKVLKMHRLGQSSEKIAGALQVPKGEVDLLVKVHKIVMRPYEELATPPVRETIAEESEKKA